MNYPNILAPAGDQTSFLAAVAAGADAVFCGLKIFSARMEAGNFSIENLSRLSTLARQHGIRLHIAFNSILKQNELDKAFKILEKLFHYVHVDALIVQDLCVVDLARQAGFTGDFHLSTLANFSFSEGFSSARDLGFQTIVLPREFSFDDLKSITEKLPESMDLEVFVHGALCYGVSGRCYWSSWFGGKSALRGRCVQPCRRMYGHKNGKGRLFSCLDFSADVLVKVLKTIPEIKTWKIEGRKKSPHYVYYTTLAYRILRDDPQNKKQALEYLSYALGRENSHYHLLGHRKSNPLEHNSDTGSGLFIGRIKNPPAPYVITREQLMVSDLIRIGHEDDQFHSVQKVSRAVPKKGKFYLDKTLKNKIRKGSPVYLIDRRGMELMEKIKKLENDLSKIPKIRIQPSENTFKPEQIKTVRSKFKKSQDIQLFRNQKSSASGTAPLACWASSRRYGESPSPKNCYWLDPVIFPGETGLCMSFIRKALKKGVKNFVLNSPWQISFFKNPLQLNLWAGPFCNISNAVSIQKLKSIGFSGVIISPELDQNNILQLPGASSLPLGIVVSGNWPLTISRIVSPDIKLQTSFKSPKGEEAWVSRQGSNYYLYPNWMLDLSTKRKQLEESGFQLFVHIKENIPRSINMKQRPATWNWDLKLL